MPIDPDLARYLADVAAAVPRAADETAAMRRARAEAVACAFPFPADSVARHERVAALPGRDVPVRVFRPRAGTLPALLFLHGGGWVGGSVATHDGACAYLAREADVLVASVEYRRAPEHPFPAPNDDAFGALEWLHANAGSIGVDASRIGVGGDSAGAHLAIGVALQARDEQGPPIAYQLLIYPVIARDFDTPSYAEHAEGPVLTRADMRWFWEQYLPDGGNGVGNGIGSRGDGVIARDARAEPGTATLEGLAPAHVVVAGNDPLRDEGTRFAQALRAAGVATTFAEEPSLTHGFVRAAPYVPAADRAMKDIARALRGGLHG